MHILYSMILENGMVDMTIGVIGADKRRDGIISGFRRDGFEVFSYGTDTDMDERALSADVVILPFPVCRGAQLNAPLCEKNINISFVSESISDSSIVFGGMLPVWMRNDFTKRRMKFFDISEYEPYTLKNAFFTAEGAVMTAIANTDFSLNGSRCAVLGYGRIGSASARLLAAFGADVRAFARNAEARARAWAEGIKAYCFCELEELMSDIDIIFNTVPSCVLDEEALGRTKDGVMIIDLASKPGGAGFDLDKGIGLSGHLLRCNFS